MAVSSALPSVVASLVVAALPAFGGQDAQNVLLLVADDVGVDRIGVYAEHPDPGRTPVIDALAREGVLFRNAWAYPRCSPTRATILTGRYGFRTGIGAVVPAQSVPGQPDFGLSYEEWTLPEVLRAGAPGVWSTAAIGKWHLGALDQGPLHPLASGFDHHAGSLHNLSDYFAWTKSVDGVLGSSALYATTDTTDDAIRAVRTLPEPWFLWVAYNAAHKPLHAPPATLHDGALSGSPSATPIEHYQAMVQALDREIGRLLAELDPAVRARTTVVFIGDNGTHKTATNAPFDPDHGKGTLYEGGVNVPLIVSGPAATAGAECTALVAATDLFATILELAGVARGELPPSVGQDSTSLVPYLRDPELPSRRSFVYAEHFAPNGPGPYSQRGRAVRGERYKLITDDLAGTRELYDLERDPFEQRDLTPGQLTGQQAQALRELLRELERIEDS